MIDPLRSTESELWVSTGNQPRESVGQHTISHRQGQDSALAPSLGVDSAIRPNSKPRIEAPRVGAGDIAGLLAEIQWKIQDTLGELNKTRITASRLEINSAIESRNQRLKENAAKMQETCFWGSLLGKVGDWVPLVLFAVGACLTATGVGAPLGVALMVSSAIAIGMTVFTKAMEKLGVDKFLAEKVLQPAFKFILTHAGELAGNLSEQFQKLGFDEKTSAWLTAGVAALTVLASGGTLLVPGVIFAAGAFVGTDPEKIDEAAAIASQLTYALAIAAVGIALTMATGNFTALASTSSKLLLAFSQALPTMAQSTNNVLDAQRQKEAFDSKAAAMIDTARIRQLQKTLEDLMQQMQEIMDTWHRAIQGSFDLVDMQQQMFNHTQTV